MSKPEAKVEDHLVAGTEARGGWAAKMIDKGRRGAPDRELRFPGARTIYVETKAKAGRLETWQERYHEDLRALGYEVLVLWTVEQVDRLFAGFDKETPAKCTYCFGEKIVHQSDGSNRLCEYCNGTGNEPPSASKIKGDQA